MISYKKLARKITVTFFMAMLLCMGGGTAYASLVEVDLNSPGDALLTYNTTTGLYWLDLTSTANLSYNDVINGVGNTWIAEGWRIAIEDEVNDLFVEVGWTDPPGDWVAANKTPAKNLTGFLGGPYGAFDDRELWLITDTSVSANQTRVNYVGYRFLNNEGRFDVYDDVWMKDRNYSGPLYSPALVSSTNPPILPTPTPIPPTPTPIPPTAALFPVGIAFMEWRRRRKSASLSSST